MKRVMRPHTLDANALLRFLTRGPGAEIVERALNAAHDAGRAVSMSVINWGEVLYTVAKGVGFEEASSTLAKVQPLVSIIDADQAVTAAAARLKLDHGLPYADCFAAVTAGRTGVLVTADPDFARIPWLRVLALPRYPRGPVKRATR